MPRWQHMRQWVTDFTRIRHVLSITFLSMFVFLHTYNTIYRLELFILFLIISCLPFPLLLSLPFPLFFPPSLFLFLLSSFPLSLFLSLPYTVYLFAPVRQKEHRQRSSSYCLSLRALVDSNLDPNNTPFIGRSVKRRKAVPRIWVYLFRPSIPPQNPKPLHVLDRDGKGSTTGSRSEWRRDLGSRAPVGWQERRGDSPAVLYGLQTQTRTKYHLWVSYIGGEGRRNVLLSHLPRRFIDLSPENCPLSWTLSFRNVILPTTP